MFILDYGVAVLVLALVQSSSWKQAFSARWLEKNDPALSLSTAALAILNTNTDRPNTLNQRFRK